MDGTEIYTGILGVRPPWRVVSAETNLVDEVVLVRVEAPSEVSFGCPRCGKKSPRHDHRKRRWQHLPTCQFRTILEVDVPRVSCPKHGVLQVPVPWAEANSSFTAMMEALVIAWLKEANISAVARLMNLSWSQVDGIMQRAVARGMARRKELAPIKIGVDETSFQKRHEYVTVVNDLDSGHVIHVADGHGKSALDCFYQQFTRETRKRIQVVAMDMWKPYIFSTAAYVPDAADKIAFDRFHIVKHLSDAVDRVRKTENRKLAKAGDDRLKGSRYLWLRKLGSMAATQRLRFEELKQASLETSKAWALKETAVKIWGYKVRGWAKRAWMKWFAWVEKTGIGSVLRSV